MTDSKKPRRAKGEQTRQSILEATLRLIVERGHHAVTHRAVAAEAGVNLSLTTYYFKDLPELIKHAFEFYSERTSKAVGDMWSSINAHLDTLSINSVEDKVHIANWLAAMAADYVLDEFENKSDNLTLEMTLFYDFHIDPELREIARKLRTRFEADFITVCRRLGSDNPTVDGALLLGELQRLEFLGLVAGGELTREKVVQQLGRLIYLILKI